VAVHEREPSIVELLMVGVIERAWVEATKDRERWQAKRKMMAELQLAEP
jgi:hypothetical protein